VITDYTHRDHRSGRPWAWGSALVSREDSQAVDGHGTTAHWLWLGTRADSPPGRGEFRWFNRWDL